MNYRFNAHIHSLNKISYISDDAAAPTEGRVIDCSLGINPFGCSPAVLQAIGSVSSSEITAYPAYPYDALRRQISEYWRGAAEVPEYCVRLGNGASGILNQINKLFIHAGSEVLGFCPQFTDYMNFVYGYGGRYDFYKLSPDMRYAFDADGFMARMHGGHTLVYLDNPSNPTGQVIPVLQIREIARRARRMNACVIIDEAYGEYMPAENSAATLIGELDNLFVVRSFSKGFGMAGLRAGYLVACKRLMEYYQRIEIPFSVNTLAHAAIYAALGDRVFVGESARRIGAVKAELISACRKLICAATGAQTSIMVLEHPDDNADLYALFLRHGVLTEAGDGFVNLSRSAVRMRVPAEGQALANIIRAVENEIR
jgi:histidinol-phosphate aminotransferase